MFIPTPSSQLTPVSERISFVYLEHCVIHRDSNAITATDEQGVIHLPAAAISNLLLGPGTSITHQAITLLADSGTTVSWVGEKAVRFYAQGLPQARSTRFLETQARLVSNRKTRLAVARKMYAMRFPREDISKLTMQQLRGREGARVRASYKLNAEKFNIPWSQRQYSPTDWASGDSVNRFLSSGNACLYGTVHAAVVALGCSPGLGFVHTGHARAFVYDIADLYKAKLTIPLAFEVASQYPNDSGTRIRHALRDRMYEERLLEKIVHDVKYLFFSDNEIEYIEEGSLALWDETKVVPAGISYLEQS